MKIDHTTQMAGIEPNPTVRKSNQGADGSFGDVLNATLQKATDTAPAETGPAAPTGSVSPLQPPEAAADPAQTLERTEQLLDLLDTYRQKLADPAFTLRDIYPIIERMEQEKQQLGPLLDALPEGDRLNEIANDALVTAAVEVFKFNKGDYQQP